MSLEQLAAKSPSQFLADYKRIKRANTAPPKPLERAPVVRDWLLVASVPEPVTPPPQPFMAKRIMQAVADEFGIPLNQLTANRRARLYIHARRCCCVLMRMHTRFSFPQIGHVLNRHHTSVIHAVEMHESRPDELAPRIKKIMEALQ